jgi:hypothetical protein
MFEKTGNGKKKEKKKKKKSGGEHAMRVHLFAG